MKKSVKSALLRGLLTLGIVMTLGALAATPLVLTAFFKASEFGPAHPHGVAIATACVYACALPYGIALFKLRKIVKLLGGQEPFSLQVAEGFKAVALCAFGEAVVLLGVVGVLYFGFGVFLLALTVIPGIVIPFGCVVVGLLALALAEAFRKAARPQADTH